MVQRGLKVVGDFLRQNGRIGKILGILQALVFEPKNVEVDLVALNDLLIVKAAPAPLRILFLISGRLALVSR